MGRMRWTAGEQAGTFAEPHWDEMRRAAARREDDSQDKLDPVDLVRRAWSDAESRGEVRWTSPRTIEAVLQSGTTAATDRAQAAMRAAEGEAEHWKRLLLVAGAVTTVLAPDPVDHLEGEWRRVDDRLQPDEVIAELAWIPLGLRGRQTVHVGCGGRLLHKCTPRARHRVPLAWAVVRMPAGRARGLVMSAITASGAQFLPGDGFFD